MWVATFQHGPKDTAIGFGTSPDYAVSAILRAYPPAAGRDIDVGEVRAGQGFSAIEKIISLRIMTTKAQEGRAVAPIPLDLDALVGESKRALLVEGLQALHRERTAAWRSADRVANERNWKRPARESFGIDEVEAMLLCAGAAPASP